MAIFRSLLEVDMYKLTMLRWIQKHFPTLPVTFEFKNRTHQAILGAEIHHRKLYEGVRKIAALRFTAAESLAATELVGGDKQFHDTLSGMILAPISTCNVDQGQFEIWTSGLWPQVTLWETLVLGTVNELYYEGLLQSEGIRPVDAHIEGDRRLSAKIAELRKHPQIKFMEFGTRRAFSRDWQYHVVRRLRDELLPGQLLGCSNVWLAQQLGIKPLGTNAHELQMALLGLYRSQGMGWAEAAKTAVQTVLATWYDMYGEPGALALTDTFGSEFFFTQCFTHELAEKYRGVRQDSGDPFAFGERTVTFYRERGITPQSKIIVFSDGLDLATILKLEERFRGRIQTVFGWGTDLTNDLGFKPLSLVMKLTEAAGKKTVKLSDNLQKATGETADIAALAKAIGYTPVSNEPCRY